MNFPCTIYLHIKTSSQQRELVYGVFVQIDCLYVHSDILILSVHALTHPYSICTCTQTSFFYLYVHSDILITGQNFKSALTFSELNQVYNQKYGADSVGLPSIQGLITQSGV